MRSNCQSCMVTGEKEPWARPALRRLRDLALPNMPPRPPVSDSVHRTGGEINPACDAAMAVHDTLGCVPMPAAIPVPRAIKPSG